MAHVSLAAGLTSYGGAIEFGPGDYTYPGGSFHAGGNLNEQTVDATSLTIVPEPSSLALAAFGLLTGAAFLVRRAFWTLQKRPI